MKTYSYILFLLICAVLTGQETEAKIIEETLDAWHRAAAEADFDGYFGLMTDDAVFIGTDATENWQLAEFKDYAKPHFEKGRAWNFSAVERNVYATGQFAWFDELLDTQMKLCRGSGVLKKMDGSWKIAHYVLSIAVPNEHVGELIKIKEAKDNDLMKELRKN